MKQQRLPVGNVFLAIQFLGDNVDKFQDCHKHMFIKTSGGCMRPLLKSGEIVFIKKTKKVFLGDIVLYEFQGKKYLHRIINRVKNDIIVCDDTGVTFPVKIKISNIIGIHPTIFNGYIGLLYNRIVFHFFLFCRKVKYWFI
ncbi:MAG: S24/S26 family peptidase [Endomicrobiia bacterium]